MSSFRTGVEGHGVVGKFTISEIHKLGLSYIGGSTDFIIGIVLIAISVLLTGCGFRSSRMSKSHHISQRVDHQTTEKNEIFISESLNKQRKKTALVYNLLMISGEVTCFCSYAFISPSVVTALRCLAIVVGVEKLCCQSGSFVTLFGAIIVVLHSPEEPMMYTIDEIWAQFVSLEFFFVTVVIITCLLWIRFMMSETRRKSRLILIPGAAFLGSYSVMACKCISTNLRFIIFNGTEEWITLPSLWVLMLIISVVIQVSFIIQAVNLYGQSDVMPHYYLMLNVCVIFFSLLFYGNWSSLGHVKIVSQLCGVLIIFTGRYLISLSNSGSTRSFISANKKDHSNGRSLEMTIQSPQFCLIHPPPSQIFYSLMAIKPAVFSSKQVPPSFQRHTEAIKTSCQTPHVTNSCSSIVTTTSEISIPVTD